MLTPKRCNLVKCGILCARGRDVPFPVEQAAERMTAIRCPVPRRKSKTLRGGRADKLECLRKTDGALFFFPPLLLPKQLSPPAWTAPC